MDDEIITCLIIDDELDVQNRLESLLLKFENIKVLAKEEIPEIAIEKVIELKPRLVFVDIEMPRVNGFEVVKTIREKGHYPTFIFVTAYNQYAIKAIKNEAFDFLLKPVDIEELGQTLDRFSTKQLNPGENSAYAGLLTTREMEIVKLLKQGLTSKAIGEKLFISKNTVDTHRRRILEKTGLNSTIELITKL